MKVNAVVFSLKGLFRKDQGLLAAFLSALTGLVSGAFVYAFVLHEKNDLIVGAFIKFTTKFSDKSDIEIFSGFALGVLFYFAALFISGSSFLGKRLSIVITLFKTAGIGTLISHLYITYGLKGLEYVLLVFFPGKIIFIFAAVLMTKCCFDMSSSVKNGVDEKGSAAQLIKMYYLKTLVYLLIFILSSAVDFFTIKIFSDLFDFSAM